MKRRGRKPKKPVEQEPGLLMQLEGIEVDKMVIAGEQWVAPAEHERALQTIQLQATEIDQIKKDTSNNGKVSGDSTNFVKPHLRCPSCWGNLGGRAARRKWVRQVSGPLQKRCYVCCECGTEWVIEIVSHEEDGVLHRKTRVSEVRELTNADGKISKQRGPAQLG